MSKTLLLVDDEPNVLRSLKRLLRRDNYTVFCAENGQEGLDILSQNNIDVVVSDYKLSKMSGAEFLGKVSSQYPQTYRMMLSGYSDFDQVMQAINDDHIYGFINKPWDDDEIRKTIADAFDKQTFIASAVKGEKEEDHFFRLRCVNKITAYQKLGAPFGLVSFKIHNLDELLEKTGAESLDALLQELCAIFNQKFADNRSMCMRFHRRQIAMLISCCSDRASFEEKLTSAFFILKDICRKKCPDLFIQFSAGGYIVCNDKINADDIIEHVSLCLEKAENKGSNTLIIEP